MTMSVLSMFGKAYQKTIYTGQKTFFVCESDEESFHRWHQFIDVCKNAKVPIGLIYRDKRGRCFVNIGKGQVIFGTEDLR